MPVATAGPILGPLLLDTVAGIIVFIALIRIATTPAGLWAHGRLSKLAWIIATIWFVPTGHGVPFPVAAAAAIWHTGRLTKRANPQPRPDPLPFAGGTEESRPGTAEPPDQSTGRES